MRRILAITAVILYAVTCFAQKDVTKFLGIPVDGPKSEMIRNLKSKGFKNVNGTDVLTGRFNGNDVRVYIVTENGKVCRLMVCDESPVSETDIKIRFNRLCSQFQDNGKYLGLEDYTIPEDEDISYEMSCHNKRYEAVFYQLPEDKSLEQLKSTIVEDAKSKYTREQLKSFSDEIRNEIFTYAFGELLDILRKKPVWFMISESNHYGKYYISIFYDNEYNRPNGEDL